MGPPKIDFSLTRAEKNGEKSRQKYWTYPYTGKKSPLTFATKIWWKRDCHRNFLSCFKSTYWPLWRGERMLFTRLYVHNLILLYFIQHHFSQPVIWSYLPDTANVFPFFLSYFFFFLSINQPQYTDCTKKMWPFI